MILGPALGGLLQHPADNISFFKGSLFLTEYPYFLPCLCSASISATGFVIGFFFLPETNARKQLGHESDHLLPSINDPESSPREQENGEENANYVEIAFPERDLKRDIGMPALMISVAYSLMAFQSIMFSEIWPLWAVRELGFDAENIGLCLSIVGIISLSSQLFLYPILSKRASSLTLFRYPLVFIGLAVVCLPCIPLLVPRNTYTVWACLIVVLGVKRLSEQIVLTSTMIIINNSAKPGMIGIVNGVAQSFASFARTFGPALGGILWAWSIQNELPFPLNHFLVFVVISCVLIVINVHAWAILKEPGFSINE